MNPEIEALVDKAHRSLTVARRLVDEGEYDFGISRAYYAMFYLAPAMLALRSESLSRHGALIASRRRSSCAASRTTKLSRVLPSPRLATCSSVRHAS